MDPLQQAAEQLFFSVVRRLPVTFVRGKGAWLWDDQGRRYLDFVAGWAVVNLGHSHPVVVQAICEQARTLTQVSNQFYSVPQTRLARLLIHHCCLDRVFFANSGAEANEGAIKLARKWGKLHRNGAFEVITTLNSFHGRTLAMVAATGKPVYQAPYHPLPAGFVNVPYDDVDAIRAATSERTCAVMLEPIQGEGGVNVPHDDYLAQVRHWCDQQNILLILDEIQTGMGRTGTLFAYEQAGIEPDILTLAKGLGNGVPIGAFLAKERAAVFEPGDHGSTFGGNPLACSAALATLSVLVEQEIPQHAAEMGDYLRQRLQELQATQCLITEVRGRGLLIAIELGAEVAQEATRLCLEEGLLVNPVKPTALRFMPPLIVTRDQVDQAVEILTRVLSRLAVPVPSPSGRGSG